MDMYKIHPDLMPLAAPIGELKPLDGNPREGDVGAVARSLEKFGQRKPCVAQVSSKQIMAGNHTLLAARSLGWDELAVVWVEEDDASAKAFSLADNRTAQLGGFNDQALYNMIMEVREEDESLLLAASYTEKDADDLLAALSDKPDDVLPELESRPAAITLNQRFMIGPFSVLNSRMKDWQERKSAWVALGIESELGRDGKPLTWNIPAPPGHGHGAMPLVNKDPK